jgi:DNA polymerase zeta
MLSEILDTRVMIKNRMKFDKDDTLLQQKLNSWQLALKLTANVTYGYTSATYSGRMPCVEIADAIVQSGKETLEKAISLIHSEERWGAEVVYGDTDSLFVHLKGKSKEEAFDIGEEIAERVTAMNPKPIKLKFEKVYLPCVLMSMKKYVGFKYEHRDQKEPEFDAKGIETVRRDGTPATQKIQETALKILFRTADLSQVKDYCVRQWAKIQQHKVSIQDFCISKEVKLGTYSEKAPPQPGVKIANERMEADHRNEPQYGERIPFVVHAGGIEKKTIAERSVEVPTLLRSDHLVLDADYYIKNKIIPPLERIFNLIGANVEQWYKEMPKYRRLRRIVAKEEEQQVGKKGKRAVTLDKWLSTVTLECVLCRGQTQRGESKLLFPFHPEET